jgi:hypothetical protein
MFSSRFWTIPMRGVNIKDTNELGELQLLDRHISDQLTPFSRKNIISYSFQS